MNIEKLTSMRLVEYFHKKSNYADSTKGEHFRTLYFRGQNCISYIKYPVFCLLKINK